MYIICQRKTPGVFFFDAFGPIEVYCCFSSYQFTSNAVGGGLCLPSSSPSDWPVGNWFPTTDADVHFVNYKNGNGGDYHLLPSSPYKNAGLDGKDLGADVDAVMNALAGVE
jgi:hypothetical protein